MYYYCQGEPQEGEKRRPSSFFQCELKIECKIDTINTIIV